MEHLPHDPVFTLRDLEIAQKIGGIEARVKTLELLNSATFVIVLGQLILNLFHGGRL